MRRIITLACTIALLLTALLVAGCKGDYVGSNITKKYHSRDCQWADQLTSDRAEWFGSIEEAESAGYSPHSCISGE